MREGIRRIGYNMQVGATRSSRGAVVLMMRLLTGAILGVVFAIAFDEIFSFGTLLFSFVVVTAVMSFLYVSRSWGLISVIVFDLFCLLLALLIRFYLVVAPGA